MRKTIFTAGGAIAVVVLAFLLPYAATPSISSDTDTNAFAGDQMYRKTEEGIVGLPVSKGKAFATLDAYLAHLQSLSTIDVTYYELRADGNYHMVSAFPSNYDGPTVFTRRELLDKYGFDE